MIGREFIAIAIQLRTTATEAAQRTRIGRAYYAAFLEGRQFAQARLGLPADRTSATHRSVAGALASIDAQLQVDLGLLRKLRNSADYDLDLPLESLGMRADQACILAGSIIARLDGLDAQLRAKTSSFDDPNVGLRLLSRDEDAMQMDALEAYFPADQRERDAVSLVLLSYPQLADIILNAIAIIGEMFPNPNITLDTQAYDDWNPPLRLMYQHPGWNDDSIETFHLLLERLRREGAVSDDLIQIYPSWSATSD